MMSRVVVMAKVPEAGRVKTRLIPRLGEEGAARLCAGMSADVFVLVQSLGIPWSIMVDGDPIHPWVQKLPVPWRPQQGADLGARLAQALRGGGIAIGTDAPTLPRELLLRALTSQAQTCFAPAFDGGYVLVGTERPEGLFEGIPWSSPHTFSASVLHARALGHSLEILPFWYDIDTPADLDFLCDQLKVLPPEVAKYTRRVMTELGFF